jgi:hypothetical protein
MRKGVAGLFRYREVSLGANGRYPDMRTTGPRFAASTFAGLQPTPEAE